MGFALLNPSYTTTHPEPLVDNGTPAPAMFATPSPPVRYLCDYPDNNMIRYSPPPVIRIALPFATCASLACLLAACAQDPVRVASDPASVGERPVEINNRQLQSSVKLHPDATIRIENPWGDIRVRSNHRAGVDVTATIQRIGVQPPPPPQLSIDENRDGFRLAVRFDGARRAPRTGRVDLVVYAPPGHPLELNTRDTLIEVKKTANPVRARSRSGRVLVINDGPIDARSRSGDVHVRPIHPGWGRLLAESDSGRIKAFLPDSRDLDVTVKAAEMAYSDFRLRSAGDNRQRLHRGSGADAVRIRTGGAAELIRVMARTAHNTKPSG